MCSDVVTTNFLNFTDFTDFTDMGYANGGMGEWEWVKFDYKKKITEKS